MEGADESANIYSLVPKNLAFGSGADTLLLGHELTDGRVRYPADELQRLAAAAPSCVCSRTFSRGDVIWKCRTCAIGDDNTCVVCQVIVHFSCGVAFPRAPSRGAAADARRVCACARRSASRMAITRATTCPSTSRGQSTVGAATVAMSRPGTAPASVASTAESTRAATRSRLCRFRYRIQPPSCSAASWRS
eukprot:scaffold4641_cov117-Isochrysis_galbana.AAC.3